MSDFFLTSHGIWQYVVLAAVVVSLVLSFAASMSPTAERVYRLTAVAVDIQVALGIVLWLVNSGWSLGFMQGWLHPILGLAAVGVLHAFVGRTRAAGAEQGNRVFRIGIIIVVVLVAAAIAIAETS
jgi:uncharacterized membrane protein